MCCDDSELDLNIALAPPNCAPDYARDRVLLEIDKIEYELRDYFDVVKHCCKALDFDVIVDRTAVRCVSYSKTYELLNQISGSDYDSTMYYCIYCGHRFSWKIHKAWYKVTKKYGLFSGFGEDEWKKLPKKYQTDQWWKELLEYMDEEEIGDEEPETPKAEPSKKGYCCFAMDSNIKYTKLIKYEKHVRKYLLIYYHSKHRKYNQIHYCSYCGTKLPKSLEEE